MRHMMTPFCLSLALAACAPQTDPKPTPQPISDAAAFAPLIGQNLASGRSDFIRMNPDGTMDGRVSGIGVEGRWEWRRSYLCKMVTVGPRGPRHEDCARLVRTGDMLAMAGEKGRGDERVYRIE